MNDTADTKEQAAPEATAPAAEKQAAPPQEQVAATPTIDREAIRPGVTVRVAQRIKEGEKERVQTFEGLVLRRRGTGGVHDTITVRKVTQGYGVERIFPLSLPTITKIEVVKRARVRRANLGYLRNPRARKLKEKSA